MEQLSGRTAVVTGGASGLGRALAHGWASHGMKVVVADIESKPAQVVADEIQASGGQAIAVQ
jgi:NAD(P)-dependent dehydrogenase (short-subunit alcohol dehydrogenase family)